MDVERLHGAMAMRGAEESEMKGEAQRLIAELEAQLASARNEIQRGEAALAEARGAADGHAAAAERMREAAEAAQELQHRSCSRMLGRRHRNLRIDLVSSSLFYSPLDWTGGFDP